MDTNISSYDIYIWSSFARCMYFEYALALCHSNLNSIAFDGFGFFSVPLQLNIELYYASGSGSSLCIQYSSFPIIIMNKILTSIIIGKNTESIFPMLMNTVQQSLFFHFKALNIPVNNTQDKDNTLLSIDKDENNFSFHSFTNLYFYCYISQCSNTGFSSVIWLEKSFRTRQ